MARPAKPVSIISKNLTKEEKKARQEAEASIKGKSDNIKPPKYLSKSQKKIFRNIVDQLNSSNILSNLDVELLTTYSIAIDRLQTLESSANKDPNLLRDKDHMNAKKQYTADQFKCGSELGLSPQSRAKIGNINQETDKIKKDMLLNALKDDDDD